MFPSLPLHLVEIVAGAYKALLVAAHLLKEKEEENLKRSCLQNESRDYLERY